MAFSNIISTLLAYFFISLAAGCASLAGIFYTAASTAPYSLAGSGYKADEYCWYIAARICEDEALFYGSAVTIAAAVLLAPLLVYLLLTRWWYYRALQKQAKDYDVERAGHQATKTLLAVETQQCVQATERARLATTVARNFATAYFAMKRAYDATVALVAAKDKEIASLNEIIQAGRGLSAQATTQFQILLGVSNDLTTKYLSAKKARGSTKKAFKILAARKDKRISTLENQLRSSKQKALDADKLREDEQKEHKVELQNLEILATALDSVTAEKNALATEKDGLLAEKSALLAENNQAASRHGNVAKNLNDTIEGLQEEVKQAGIEKAKLETSHQNELTLLKKDHESNTATIQTSLDLVSAEKDRLLAEKEKSAVEHEDAAKQLEETIEHLQEVVEQAGVEKEELATSNQSKLTSLEESHKGTTAIMKASLDRVSAEKDTLLAEMKKTAGEHETAAKQLNETIELLQNDIKDADLKNQELKTSHQSKLDLLKKEYEKDLDLQLDVCSKNLTNLDDRALRAEKALKDRDDAAEEAAETKAELEKKIDELETSVGRKLHTNLWLAERINRRWLQGESSRSDAGVLRGLGSQAAQRAEGRGQRSSSVGAQRAPEASLDDVLEEPLDLNDDFEEPLDDSFEDSEMTEAHEANGQQQVTETAGLEPADPEELNDRFVTAMRTACPALLPLSAHTDEGYGSSAAGIDVDGDSASEHGSQQLQRGRPELQPLPAVTNEIKRLNTAESDADDNDVSGDGSPQLQRALANIKLPPAFAGKVPRPRTAESDVDDNNMSGDLSQQLQRSSPDLQPLPAAIDENDGVSAAESDLFDNDVSGDGSEQLQRALAVIRLPPAFTGKVQRPRTAESDVDDHEVIPDKGFKKMARALDNIPLWTAPTDPFQKHGTRETGRMGNTRSYESQDVRNQPAAARAPAPLWPASTREFQRPRTRETDRLGYARGHGPQDVRVQLAAWNGLGGRNAQGTMPQGLGSGNGGNQGFHQGHSNAQAQGQQVSGRPTGTNDGSNRGHLNLNPGVPPPQAPRGSVAANNGANRGLYNDQTGPQAPSERPRMHEAYNNRFGANPQRAGAYLYTPQKPARGGGRW